MNTNDSRGIIFSEKNLTDDWLHSNFRKDFIFGKNPKLARMLRLNNKQIMQAVVVRVRIRCVRSMSLL
jgi:hypothetical protein